MLSQSRIAEIVDLWILWIRLGETARQKNREGVACGVSLTKAVRVSRSPNLPSSSSIGPAGAQKNRASFENEDANTTEAYRSKKGTLQNNSGVY
jgi:hypothetical protein